jgi:phospholipid/cholesterol/gamma-HCH transport system substrate-binding protein
VRKGLSDFIKGNAATFEGQGEAGNEAFKYFGPALNRVDAFTRELNADQHLLENFVVGSARLATTAARRGEQLSSAISNANTAFDAIASQNVAFDQTLRRLPPVMRQANTTFVNLRAALDDLDPLVETAKPATKNLAPFLAELRPVLSKFVPFIRNLRLTVALLAVLPTVQQLASNAFPHSEDAIAAFQPDLNFFRAYTPDFFNGLGKIGQITGYYDGNGHYARAAVTAQNLFSYEGGNLKPITKGQQYDVFGSSASVRRPCPGGVTQRAPDGSNPFVNPPFGGSVNSSECNPSDVPPGP